MDSTGSLDTRTVGREPDEMDSLASASRAVAVLTLLSRATGFARGVVIAAVLGPTFFGNLFIATNSLPNLIYEFAVGSLLVSLLVPPLIHHLDLGDPDRARRLANGTLGFLGLAFVGLAVVLVAGGPLVLRALGAGIDDPGVLDDQRRVGWPLLALVIPQSALYAVVGISAAVQNAHGRYYLTAAAPIAENVGTMAVFLAFALRWGTGVPLEEVTTAQMLFLGVGATGAVAVHAVVQWWGAWRVSHALIPTAGWRDPDVLALMRLGVSSLGYAALNTSRYVVALVAAGSVSGGVVAYQLALNFRDLPNALINKPLTVTSLSPLSRLAQAGSWNEFSRLYRSTVRLSAFLQGVTVVILVVLAEPIVRSIAFGDMSSDTGRTLLVAALATMSLGIVGDGTFYLATNASYARRDAGAPFRVMAIRATVTAIGAGVALTVDGTATLVTLGLSIALADLLAGYLLHEVIEQRVGSAGRRDLVRPVLGILAAAVASAAVGAATIGLALPSSLGTSRVVHVARTGVASVLVLATYLGITRALRFDDWHGFDRFLPNRRTTGRAAVRRRRAVLAGPAGRRAVLAGPAGRRAVLAGPAGRRAVLAGPAGRRAVLAGGAGLAVIVIGVGVAQFGLLFSAAVVGAVLVGLVAWRPALAAAVLLGSSPLIVGIDRGKVIPQLRVNEALLAVLIVGLLIRALVAPRSRAHLYPADAAVAAVALAGSIVPLVVLIGRRGGFTFDEFVYAFPLVKLALVYLVIRVAVRTSAEAGLVLRAGMVAAAIAGLIGFAQSIGVGPVRTFLSSGLYAGGVDPGAAISSGRGTSTLGSAIGAAGLYLGYLFVALAWLRRPNAPRRFLVAIVVALLIGVAGTAQFTAVIGLVVGGLAFRHLGWSPASVRRSASSPDPGRSVAVARLRRVPRPVVIGGGAAGLVAGWFVFAPRIAGLLHGDLPQSWTERWHNLSTHFLSELGLNTNLLIGVSPVTQVRDPRGFVEWIWIESGYVQLVYTAGIPLLATFVWMMREHLKVGWQNRLQPDELGACAAAAWVLGIILSVLMVLDPHLTIRGTSDVFFPLLALSVSGAVVSGPSLARRSSPSPAILRTPALGALT